MRGFHPFSIQHLRVLFQLFNLLTSKGRNLIWFYLHSVVAVILIENSADVNSTNNKGLSPLHMAAQIGFLYNIFKSIGFSNFSAIFYPGKSELVGVLLRNGAYVNAKNGGGWTPLHLAAQYGNNIKILLCRSLHFH